MADTWIVRARVDISRVRRGVFDSGAEMVMR